MWKNDSEVTMHMEHKDGDKMFVEYAGEKLYIVDFNTGQLQSVEVFVAILGFSQLTYAEAGGLDRLHRSAGSFRASCPYPDNQGVVVPNIKTKAKRGITAEEDIRSMREEESV